MSNDFGNVYEALLELDTICKQNSVEPISYLPAVIKGAEGLQGLVKRVDELKVALSGSCDDLERLLQHIRGSCDLCQGKPPAGFMCSACGQEGADPTIGANGGGG